MVIEAAGKQPLGSHLLRARTMLLRRSIVRDVFDSAREVVVVLGKLATGTDCRDQQGTWLISGEVACGPLLANGRHDCRTELHAYLTDVLSDHGKSSPGSTSKPATTRNASKIWESQYCLRAAKLKVVAQANYTGKFDDIVRGRGYPIQSWRLGHLHILLAERRWSRLARINPWSLLSLCRNLLMFRS